MQRSRALSTRADTRTLSAWAGSDLAWRRLLASEAPAAAWRVMEAFSVSGRPFELWLRWSAGSGAGAECRVTVARSTRVGLFARSVIVDAANLSSQENKVGVTVADGAVHTRNHWEVRGQAQEAVENDVELPAFADRLRLELADPALLAAAEIRFYDAQGVLRGVTLGDQQPSGGLPLGGADQVRLVVGATTAFRAVYGLHL